MTIVGGVTIFIIVSVILAFVISMWANSMPTYRFHVECYSDSKNIFSGDVQSKNHGGYIVIATNETVYLPTQSCVFTELK